MEPKPFDLEAAKRGEPIMQRDGTPVKFVAYEPAAVVPLVVLIGRDLTFRYSDGTNNISVQTPRDLVMAPKKRKVTVRLWRDRISGVEFATVGENATCHPSPLLGEWTTEVP